MRVAAARGLMRALDQLVARVDVDAGLFVRHQGHIGGPTLVPLSPASPDETDGSKRGRARPCCTRTVGEWKD